MYTVVKLFTLLTRNIGQNINAWENIVDLDQTASLGICTLYHCTRKIVTKEIFTIIRIIGKVVPIFSIITLDILY